MQRLENKFYKIHLLTLSQVDPMCMAEHMLGFFLRLGKKKGEYNDTKSTIVSQ